MILLTGATGLVGSALLRRLTARGEPIRVLVRDTRRLGPERVRVQIVLGDLADPHSFRHAMRGVRTVVHLAAAERDQEHASIEELDGLATWRLLRAAERAGVEHFVFTSHLGATPHHAARVQRAKALAEAAVAEADLRTTTLALSLVYAPGDRRLQLAHRLGLLPVVPAPGFRAARSQPIWAEDVAAALDAVITGEHGPRLELAGPEELTHRAILSLAMRAAGRRRGVVSLPDPLLRRMLEANEALAGSAAFATWDEVQVLTGSMLSARGTADAEALGVHPARMGDVLGVTGRR